MQGAGKSGPGKGNPGETEARSCVKRAKAIVKANCSRCDASSREGIEQIERALTALGEEGRTIGQLKEQLRGLRSTKGRAGGLRSAELRGESDDEVRRDLEGDPVHLELWEKHKRHIRGTKKMTRTEAFWHWLHDHSAAVDELRAEQQRRIEDEVEAAYGARKNLDTAGQLDHALQAIEQLRANLAKCERRAEVPF